MTGAIDIGRSRVLIDEAEARLAYQRAIVRDLGLDVDPRFAAIASQTLAMMEDSVVRLRDEHASLLNELRGPRAPAAATFQAAPDLQNSAARGA